MSFYLNLKIRSKLLISYLFAFCFILSISGSFLYISLRNSIKQNIELELKNSTDTITNMVKTSASVAIRNHLRAIAEKNKEFLESLISDDISGHIAVDNLKHIAEQFLLKQKIGDTGYVYVLNSSGFIDVHPNDKVKGSDVTSFDFVKEQLKRKEGYLEYDWKNPGEKEERPKALYMTYFEPWDWIISVSSYREEFSKLIDVEDFRENILSLKFGTTGYPYVMDSKGELIIHPILKGSVYNATDANGWFFIQDMCEQKNGRIVYSWKNPGEEKFRKKLVFFSYIPELDWIVASSSYLEEFYSPLETLKKIIFITMGISLIFLLLLTYLISSSITTPLSHLINNLKKAGLGDYSIRMHEKSKDEIGMVSQYFDNFMEELELEISNRKLAVEGMREAKESAERANKLKSQFVFNISHEIRTPLNCIIGFAEFILQGKEIKKTHEQAKIILQESDILLSLINSLLDQAKLESGKMELEFRPLDLAKLLLSIETGMKVHAEKKELKFNFELNDNVCKYVIGDELRLRQILINLLNNAIKFTDSGSVTLKVFAYSYDKEFDNICFEVIDTGIGIPLEKQDTIFKSFSQVDGSVTRKYGGTGLGTTIAKELIQLMGGNIELESEVGKGSRFWFILPMNKCSPKQVKELEADNKLIFEDDIATTQKDASDEFKVLIAEDYLVNQVIARSHLESMGYQVMVAENGKEAVELCKKEIFDLILMDIQMPELDGYQATELIRKNIVQYSDVPIIAMTANADSEARQSCLAAGMNDVLVKPIKRKMFCSVIERWYEVSIRRKK